MYHNVKSLHKHMTTAVTGKGIAMLHMILYHIHIRAVNYNIVLA